SSGSSGDAGSSGNANSSPSGGTAGSAYTQTNSLAPAAGLSDQAHFTPAVGCDAANRGGRA
ncbi:MAG: hypothetical protein FWF30_03515, partial [Coriobacteriia bacterium]|nr:hypothetical protein [Coriobacteriia bacterium]